MKKKTDWTIAEMMQWGKEYFSEKNIDSPRLTIEMMVSAVTNLSRLQIYTQHDTPLSEQEITELRSYVRRRIQREPLQYILGKTYFYGLEFIVSPDVLMPRPETEVLVDTALNIISQSPFASSSQPTARFTSMEPILQHISTEDLTVLDIGTGSGCIALALAQHTPTAVITAIDISDTALGIAEQNRSRLQIDNVNFVQADIFQARTNTKKRQEQDKYSLIVSNPPYISQKGMSETQSEVQDFEPSIALTDNHDSFSFYECFAEVFPGMMREDGVFLLECGIGMSDKVASMFESTFTTEVIADLEGVERFVLGKKV